MNCPPSARPARARAGSTPGYRPAAGTAIPSATRTSIFIIDQERTFADALAVRLEAEQDVQVVIAVHRQSPAPSLIAGRHADVILLDADLPDNAAVDLCAELRSRPEPPHVVMLSRGAEPERIADSVRAGAAAWVRKSESLDHLLHVIQGVTAGETWLPPAELGAVLRLLLAGREQQCESDRLLSALTPREREVLTFLADGAGRRDIAERLQLSANTVRTHLQNLMAKLGVHSALEAAALARSQLTPTVPGPAHADQPPAPEPSSPLGSGGPRFRSVADAQTLKRNSTTSPSCMT